MTLPLSSPRTRWARDAERLLRGTFGLEKLRTGQREVIRNVMEGRDTLAVMPTGAGKSLCYQLPALMLPGRTVVVSPLIALMKDQCDKLRDAGIAAVQLNSALDAGEIEEADGAVADGSARIVFTTPERLATPDLRAALAASPTSLLVIDEAHCISQWGHDFRPAFLEVGAALGALGRPTLLALTATASDEVADDIVEQLGVRSLSRVSTGIYRPNLRFAVEPCLGEHEKLQRLTTLVQDEPGAIIVYASTVKAVDAVHAALSAAGVSVGRYHGKLAAKARRTEQDAFMRGDVRVMVATNAFGLGIDRADVRAVVHYQMPGGLDAYYQEAGRAGRDGAPATCTLLYLDGDKAVQRFFLAGRYPAFEDVEAVYLKLVETPPDGVSWTVGSLLQALDRPRGKVQVALVLLRRERVVSVRRDGTLAVRRGDLDPAAVERLLVGYRAKREHDHDLLEQIVFYGQTGICRWQVLLKHFDADIPFERCGHCDNCDRLADVDAAGDAAVDAAAVSDDVAAAGELNGPTTAATFRVGDRVQVPRYGSGTVGEADALRVTVDFPSGERRCFLAAYVRLRPAARTGTAVRASARSTGGKTHDPKPSAA